MGRVKATCSDVERPTKRPRQRGITRTNSFWWGEGASLDCTPSGTDVHTASTRALLADALTVGVGASAIAAAAAFAEVMVGGSSAAHSLGFTIPTLLSTLFTVFIPGLSGLALAVMILQLIRVSAKRVKPATLPDLGRKGLMVCTSGLLFAFSCFYRSINIADEGAAMCRNRATAFNAPVAGRAVATVGEIALVVQVSLYIEGTGARLGATRGLWAAVFRLYTSAPFSTVGPVLLAEAMSWSGVLSGISKFYCVEYILWCIVAFTWAWDAAELLYRSKGPRDTGIHAGLLIGSVFLFLFNALVEIPHFFDYSREADPAASTAPGSGIWECVHDENSPLWLKRLPFFFCYFVGAAWSAVALAYRFVRAASIAQKRLRKLSE